MCVSMKSRNTEDTFLEVANHVNVTENACERINGLSSSIDLGMARESFASIRGLV